MDRPISMLFLGENYVKSERSGVKIGNNLPNNLSKSRRSLFQTFQKYPVIEKSTVFRKNFFYKNGIVNFFVKLLTWIFEIHWKLLVRTMINKWWNLTKLFIVVYCNNYKHNSREKFSLFSIMTTLNKRESGWMNHDSKMKSTIFHYTPGNDFRFRVVTRFVTNFQKMTIFDDFFFEWIWKFMNRR